ncbi:MAG: hypothetical protein K1X53_11075 [Candidatus Sumerlaeaceae bacterium]|nr:hypothetical protein [Candidatus Sumerlaeaceae bacterium]
MSRQKILAIVLLVAAGGYGFWWYQRHQPTPEQLEATRKDREKQAKKEKITEQEKVIAEAQKRDYENAMKDREARKKSPPPKLTFTEAERYPLADGAKFLMESTTVTLGSLPKVLFLAPLYSASPADPKPTTATQILQDLVRYQLTAATGDRLLVNLVPTSYMSLPYTDASGEMNYKGRKPEEYLRDATTMGADVLVYGRADEVGENVVIQLGLADLKTSRTDTFSMSQPSSKAGEVINAAVTKIAGFTGISQADQAEAGLTSGSPSAEAYAMFKKLIAVKPPDTTAALALAEGCPALYANVSYLVDDRNQALEIMNDAIRLHPRDYRLQYAKSRLLRALGSPHAAHLLLSDLARRYPASLIFADQMADSLYALSRYRPAAAQVAPAYRGALQFLETQANAMPGNWALHWDYGNELWAFAESGGYLGLEEAGSDIDKNDPAAVRRFMEEYFRNVGNSTKEYLAKAIAQFKMAVAGRPDCARLLAELVRLQIRAGENDFTVQSPLLARIGLLDPKNVDADFAVAEAQFETNPAAALSVLRDVAKRTNNDPQVMYQVATTMIEPLRARMNWYNRGNQNPGALTGLPEADFYYEAMTTALKADLVIYPAQIDMLSKVLQSRGEAKRWKEIFEPYLKRSFKRASEAQTKGRWAESLKWADAVHDLFGGQDRERMGYCIVKSMWKLKRHREALERCEYEIMLAPDRHTFHYMFAVIALDLGDNLEEAYEHAKIAIPLDPTNQGIKETLKKLGEKLGKPTTV